MTASRLLDHPRGCLGVRWSAAIRRDGSVLDTLDADDTLPTASVGKVFLLATVGELIERGDLDPAEELTPSAAVEVADSGLLQFFDGRRQRVADLAVLVGAVSDNLATNALLERVGLDTVAATARRLGATASGLHDFVRDRRGPAHPPFLSTGSGGEWAWLMERLAAGRLAGPDVDARVRRWLGYGTDLSMVASAFALDPLAHADRDVGIVVVNKTGANVGTRADIGIVDAGGEVVTYAVIARWADDSYELRRRVLDAMAGVGHAIREFLFA